LDLVGPFHANLNRKKSINIAPSPHLSLLRYYGGKDLLPNTGVATVAGFVETKLWLDW
jgi:hypothetical protein